MSATHIIENRCHVCDFLWVQWYWMIFCVCFPRRFFWLLTMNLQQSLFGLALLFRFTRVGTQNQKKIFNSRKRLTTANCVCVCVLQHNRHKNQLSVTFSGAIIIWLQFSNCRFSGCKIVETETPLECYAAFGVFVLCAWASGNGIDFCRFDRTMKIINRCWYE